MLDASHFARGKFGPWGLEVESEKSLRARNVAALKRLTYLRAF